MAQHKYEAAGPPLFTPARVNDHYQDTSSGKVYISVGTSSASDWKELVLNPPPTSSGYGVIVYDGLLYVWNETDNKFYPMWLKGLTPVTWTNGAPIAGF